MKQHTLNHLICFYESAILSVFGHQLNKRKSIASRQTAELCHQKLPKLLNKKKKARLSRGKHFTSHQKLNAAIVEYKEFTAVLKWSG